jgi:hypothetical protein
VDDDTISGVISETDRNWTLDLLVDVLAKAVAVRRWEDVSKMLARARSNIEGRLATDHAIQRHQLDQVAEAAVQLATHRADVEWAAWTLNIHATLGWVPAESVLQPLDLMPDHVRRELTTPAERLLRAVIRSSPELESSASLVRVRALCSG